MNSSISPLAAIDAIKRRTAQRVYAETPALKLLGMEDKAQARLEWKGWVGRPILDTELRLLDNVRNEIARRPKSEMDEAQIEWIRRNKVWSYFPDEGPFRRELYPEHMNFVAATKTDDEVMMLAANRCITPWTPVETDHGERLARELIGETGFDVRAWDGNSRCTKKASPVFLVGIEPAFQIHLDNGEVFQCSGRHRVLRDASMDVHHPEALGSITQQIRGLNGLHLTRTIRGWSASYGGGDHLCDGLLPLPGGAFGWPLPIRHGAPSNGQNYSPADAAASRFARTHAYPDFGQSANSDDPYQLADLCDKTEAPGASLFVLPKTLRDRISHQLQCGLSPDPVEILVALEPQLSLLPQLSRLLLAFDSPKLFNGRSIVAVVPLGLQPIIDFTVEGAENYFSGGIVHHNTGKSQLGALCVAHWAMGRYPKWWDGRLFDAPTTGWVCNKTAKDCRDINEAELLGPPGSEAERGTGMIPSHLIQKCTPKPGTPNAYEFISVEHVSGATSYIVTKSYDQGRTAFQGRKIDYGWGDEEIDRECYDEMYMRSSVRGDIATGVQPPGVLILTYTPIQGLTEMTTWFMESAGLSLEAMRQGELDMEEVLG